MGLAKLQSACFGFNIKICISLFVCGLPPVPAFNTLRADLPRRIALVAWDDDFGAFVALRKQYWSWTPFSIPLLLRSFLAHLVQLLLFPFPLPLPLFLFYG